MKLSNVVIAILLIAGLPLTVFLMSESALAFAPVYKAAGTIGNQDPSDPFGGSVGDDEENPFGNTSPVSTIVDPPTDENALKNRARIRTTDEIEQKLKKPSAMQYEECPFNEVMDELRDHNGINVILDHSAMDDSLTADELITFHLRDTDLGTALRLLLASHNATYVIDNGVLKVISLDVASDSEYFRRKIFDCRELIAKIERSDSRVGQPISNARGGGGGGGGGGRGQGGGFGGGGGGGVFSVSPQTGDADVAQANAPAGGGGSGGTQQPARQHVSPLSNVPRVTAEQLLTELIRISIDPNGWDNTNGDGTIMVIGGLMVVAQTQNVLEELEQLLENLNRAMSKRL